jgi:hypothetical protein
MAAPTNAAFVKKVLANSEPSTHDPKRTSAELQFARVSFVSMNEFFFELENSPRVFSQIFSTWRSSARLKSFLSELRTPARFFDPLLDHKSGHSVTTQQHRLTICGMFGDLQNFHGLSMVEPVSPLRSRP